MFSDRDCNEYLENVDDFNQLDNAMYHLLKNIFAYSFQLLYRDLQDQEQLDIFTKNFSDDSCNDFINSYFVDIFTSCNN